MQGKTHAERSTASGHPVDCFAWVYGRPIPLNALSTLRVAEVERSNNELGLQLVQAKEQLKFLHVSRRSEAQVPTLVSIPT